jgi:hypothetical protein
MATTSRPIDILKVGIRDTTGAVVASGLTRFYQPGTLVSQTVYSDATCATAYSQPITSNAGGQATVYTLEPVRMISKDSTETTTYYDGVVNLNRHDALYITHADFNGGAETTLENLLTDMATALGDDFEFQESATATGIGDATYLCDLCVSVKSYGALGDDANDDTAEIQATIDRVEARGGGWVYFPKGTYKISSALTIDFAGVKIVGAGIGVSIIKNYSTSGNAISYTLGAATDSKFVVRDITITANSTSSGAAIIVNSGASPLIRDIASLLHRTGVDVSAVLGATVDRVRIDSTDGNAAAVGISLGGGRATNCSIVSATNTGTGLVLGADSRANDMVVTEFTTGVLMSGARAQLRGVYISGAQTTGINATGASTMISHAYVNGATTGASLAGTFSTISFSRILATTGISLGAANADAQNCSLVSCTTGVSMGAASTHVDGCGFSSCTTGVSVGAHASCAVTNCDASGNTLDLSVNASATLFREHNAFTTITSTGATPLGIPARFRLVITNPGTVGPTWTPSADPTVLNSFVNSYAAGAATVTINVPVTTNTQPGDTLHMVVGAYVTQTTQMDYASTWLKDMEGAAVSSGLTVANNTSCYVMAVWTGTYYAQVMRISNTSNMLL